MTKTKICKKCNNELPATKEYFSANKLCKNGIEGTCRKCAVDRSRKYRENNQEVVSEYMKKWREDNKEDIRNKEKEWYKENREAICYKNRNENKDNKSKIFKKWYENNKESALKRKKQWHENNREKVFIYQKEWCKNNRNKTRMYCQKRRSAKNNLPSTLTVKQWDEIKQYFDNKCAYCNKEKPLMQDHFIALSKSGEYSHNNIIPACGNCNSSKSAKDFKLWYKTYKYYSKKREDKILNFLGYKGNVQQLAIGI